MPTRDERAERIERVVRFTPGITRKAVAERLGLSVTTVNPFVADLVGRGVVDEVRDTAPGRGRPSAGLRLVGPAESLGLVLWSHGTLDAVLVGYDGAVLWRERHPARGYPRLDRVTGAAERILAAAGRDPSVRSPRVVVLGLPAPYERGVGLPSHASGEPSEATHYADWFDADPGRLLSERTGLPVVVVNDANLGALGETRDGAAVGGRCVIGVTMSGYGIGSGITVHGDLLEGSHGFAGELSHVRVDDASTEICICGSRGCLRQKLGRGMLAPLVPVYGEDITYERVLGLVADGDPGAIRVLEDAGRTVGRALADIATYLDPDVVVLDAGTPEGTAVVLRGIAEQVQQSTPPFIRRGLDLRATALGDLATVRGAVHVARAAATR